METGDLREPHMNSPSPGRTTYLVDVTNFSSYPGKRDLKFLQENSQLLQKTTD